MWVLCCCVCVLAHTLLRRSRAAARHHHVRPLPRQLFGACTVQFGKSVSALFSCPRVRALASPLHLSSCIALHHGPTPPHQRGPRARCRPAPATTSGTTLRARSTRSLWTSSSRCGERGQEPGAATPRALWPACTRKPCTRCADRARRTGTAPWRTALRCRQLLARACAAADRWRARVLPLPRVSLATLPRFLAPPHARAPGTCTSRAGACRRA